MGTAVGPNVITNGLVFAVDAAASRSYPDSGTTLYDLSGNGYDFTSTVPCSFTSGVNGVTCLDFTSGNQERLDSIKLSPFSGDNFAITVSAVINENSRSSYKTILSQHEQDSVDSMSFCSLNLSSKVSSLCKSDLASTESSLRFCLAIFPSLILLNKVSALSIGKVLISSLSAISFN
mgnify:CR=1 FL=1